MDLSEIGKILSSESRVQILLALMSGEALPASELAYRAGVSNQTISEHLRILADTKVVRARKCGRHRYFELFDSDVAQSLERMSLSFQLPLKRLKSNVPERLKLARFCYDHLAGHIATNIAQKLVNDGALLLTDRDYTIVSDTHRTFEAFGLNLADIRKRKRRLASRCLDWSERKPHLAGALGAAFANRWLELGWIEHSRDDRSAIITEIGRKGFSDSFGLDWQTVLAQEGDGSLSHQAATDTAHACEPR